MLLRDKKNFFSRPLFISFILLFIIGLLFGPLLSNFSKKRKIDAEIVELQTEIMKLEDGNSNFKKLLEYLKSDQFAEAQARLNFGLKKPGEEVVVVKGDDVFKTIINSDNESEKKSNPVKWLRYFLKMK